MAIKNDPQSNKLQKESESGTTPKPNAEARIDIDSLRLDTEIRRYIDHFRDSPEAASLNSCQLGGSRVVLEPLCLARIQKALDRRVVFETGADTERIEALADALKHWKLSRPDFGGMP